MDDETEAVLTNSGTPANRCTTTITLASDGYIADDAWVRLSPAAYEAMVAHLAASAGLVAAARDYATTCDAYKRATFAVREAEGTERMFDRDLAIAWDETGKAYSAAHDVLCNAALAVQPAESEAGGE